MFRRKFIDRLRNKYQTGGKKEPYISIGGKSINTPINSKVGFGGKISLPFLESIDHGKSATGLRGELDASFTRGDRKLASQLEAETSVGELPKDMATSPKTWNAAVGLRGYHNRAIGRNRGLSLNSSVGAGLGSGEKHGAFMYQDPNGFGGATYNHGMDRDIKPYADANMSLLKHGQHRGSGGTDVSGGINASYGTKFSPNPGLRAGVQGSFGPFKGNVGYDFTNKSPRVGISANFQKGGFDYSSDKSDQEMSNTYSNIVDDENTQYSNDFKKPQLTYIGGKGVDKHSGLPWREATKLYKERTESKYTSVHSSRNKNPEDYTYNEAFHQARANYEKTFTHNGKEYSTRLKEETVDQFEKSFVKGSPEYKARFKEISDRRRIGLTGNYTSSDRSGAFPSSTAKTDEFQSGGLKYNTMDKVQDGLTVAGLTPALGIFPDALNTIISAGRGAYNYATGDTKRANSQMGDLALNAASMIPAAGQAAGTLKLVKTANTLNKASKVIKPLDKVDALNSANSLIKSTVPSTNNTVGAPLRNTTPKPTNSFMPTSISNNFAETGGVRHQEGGMYNQMQQYQQGGMALPGGEMQPIPGSDAVQFNGQSHDQGGIMVDSQTEVEGGETMDKVNMAKKGGKRDYFFSSHLKEGGRSYADMHKEILANGGSQEKINMLAKMQEVAAGRDPKQVAKLGGMAEYQMGGQMNNPFAGSGDTDNNNNGIPDSQEEGNEEVVVVNTESPTEGYDNRSLEDMKADEYAELYNKAKKKADKGRGTPAEAWVGMGAQMLPSMYAFLHKQKKPEDATYTQGFKSPIHSQTVKAQKLDRVNYNDKRSQLSSSIRGANKFIETSGGGPANMANLQATLAKDIMGQMQINAEETKANVAIDNREKQLAQQAALDNVKRSQAASTMNAQLARIEAARRDTIEGGNVTARNQWQSDQELNKMNALTSTAQGIAGGAGDIMSYKANERMARAIGSEGIYQRDIMRDFIGKRAKKDGIPGLCGQEGLPACTDDIVNEYIANKGVFQNTEEKES